MRGIRVAAAMAALCLLYLWFRRDSEAVLRDIAYLEDDAWFI